MKVTRAWIPVQNRNKTKYLRFLLPMQVPIHGQWWSCTSIQNPQVEQWNDLGGLTIWQVVQYVSIETVSSTCLIWASSAASYLIDWYFSSDTNSNWLMEKNFWTGVWDWSCSSSDIIWSASLYLHLYCFVYCIDLERILGIIPGSVAEHKCNILRTLIMLAKYTIPMNQQATHPTRYWLIHVPTMLDGMKTRRAVNQTQHQFEG